MTEVCLGTKLLQQIIQTLILLAKINLNIFQFLLHREQPVAIININQTAL